MTLFGTGRADREAARWLARLNQPLVTQRDLAAFRRWRETANNDAAFRNVQGVWREAGRLRDDPELEAALAGARRRGGPSPARLGHGAAVAATAVAALALVGVFAVAGPWRPNETFATGVGERSTVHLADGSVVQLDTDTRLTVRLSRADRRLSLEQGQALFTVAHDAARPFRVRAGTLDVVATGTRFDVRRDGPRGPTVVLLEGRVRVTRTAGAPEPGVDLAAGQEVTGARLSPARRADPEAAAAWTTGQLIFRDAPLAEVVAEANRYSHRRIVLDRPEALSALRVSGAFATGDTAALALALSELHDLAAEPAPDGGVKLTRRPGSRDGGGAGPGG